MGLENRNCSDFSLFPLRGGKKYIKSKLEIAESLVQCWAGGGEVGAEDGGWDIVTLGLRWGRGRGNRAQIVGSDCCLGWLFLLEFTSRKRLSSSALVKRGNAECPAGLFFSLGWEPQLVTE